MVPLRSLFRTACLTLITITICGAGPITNYQYSFFGQSLSNGPIFNFQASFPNLITGDTVVNPSQDTICDSSGLGTCSFAELVPDTTGFSFNGNAEDVIALNFGPGTYFFHFPVATFSTLGTTTDLNGTSILAIQQKVTDNTPAPEPEALAVMSCGLAALFLHLRRAQKRS
jgi:hypothetical protein